MFPDKNNYRITLVMLALQCVLIFALVYLALFTPVAQAKREPYKGGPGADIYRLSPGMHIQRSIFSSKRHIYKFPLNAGQYLRILVVKQDIDLGIRVFDPRQNKLFDLNSRRYGATLIALVADSPGVFQLELRQLIAEAETGHYGLKVEIEHRATEKERSDIIAQQAFTEAEKLNLELTPESLLSAITKYEEALSYWQDSGNLQEEAYALKSIGDTFLKLTQNDKARDYFNRALELSKVVGDRQLEIESLNDIGYIENDLNNPAKTVEYCTLARSLSQEIGYRRGEAQALDNIGLTYYNSGDMRQALDLFKQSLSLWEDASDSRGQAQTLVHAGYASGDLGETQKAITYFNQALEFSRRTLDMKVQVQALAALGLAHTWQGEMQKGFDAHKEALQIAQMIGDRFGKAVSLNGMGYFYDSFGEKQRALECHDQAAQLFRDLGNQNYEAYTIGFAGNIYCSLGDVERALECYQRELEICRAIPNQRMEAYALRDIGSAYDMMGNADEALRHYDSALSLSKVVDDPRGQAYILNKLGLTYNGLKEKQKALDCYNEALALMEGVKDKSGEILTRYNLAKLKRDSGETAQAIEQVKTVLDMTERLRADIISKDLRDSYLASIHQCFELYIDLLMRMHAQNPSARFDVAAFEISERGRARSLLEMLTEARIDIRQGVDPVLLRAERDLQQQLNTKAERQTLLLSQTYSKQSDPNHTVNQEISALANEIEDLAARFDEVEAQIRARSPKYAALTQPQALPVSKLQRLLDPNTVLLEYSLGDERSYLWAITRNSITSCQLPGRNEIEQATIGLYNMITSPELRDPGNASESGDERLKQIKSEWLKAGMRLSQVILGPVASQLRAKRLVIVADGALQYLPFAALPEPDISQQSGEAWQPLIVNHEIVSLPALSALAAIRKATARRAKAARTLAVLADPVYEEEDARIKRKKPPSGNRQAKGSANAYIDGPQYTPLESPAGKRDGVSGFHRLPFAWREAKAIAGLVPRRRRKIATDFEASRKLAISAELRKYRIVHFATHGLLRNDYPKLSGLVLSLVDESGRPQDGFLRLNEVYNMRLQADLVVLSACQTALGKQIKGEGLVGLTRGFMYAGVASVAATLWKVDDRAAAELMKHFYRAMLGPKRLQASAALRLAQVSMIKRERWKSPYYWAGYVLQGEWGKPSPSRR